MASNVTLLTTDRNSVFLLIQQAHLDPAEFRWENVVDSDGFDHYSYEFLMSRLIHKPTDFYY